MKTQLSAEEYSVAALQEELNQLLTAKEEIDETLTLLRADNTRKDSKVYDLSDKIEELEKFKSSLNKNMSEVETENSCLKLKMEDKTSEIASLKDKVSDFHEEIAKLQEELLAKDEAISAAKRNLGNKENVLNSTLTELSCLKTEIEALKAEIAVSNRRISDLEATKTDLERSLSEKSEKLETMEEKMRHLKSEKELLDTEIQKKDTEIDLKSGELYKKAKKLDEITEKNSLLEKTCENKQMQIEKLELENDEKAQLWDSLSAKLENDLLKKESEIEMLLDLNADLKSQLDNGTLKVALLEDQKAVNEENLRKENEFVLRELDRLKGTIVDLEQVKTRLETISTDKDSESNRLRKEIADKDVELEKLRIFKTNAEEELLEVRNGVKEGTLRHEKLCSPENSINFENGAEFNSTWRSVPNHEKSFHREDADSNSAGLFGAYKNTSAELKKLIDASNRELESSKQQVADLSKQVDILKEQILRSEAVFDDMHEQLDREKARSHGLQEKLNKLKDNTMVKSVENKACNTDLKTEDYSGVYLQLLELAGTSPKEGAGSSSTEASLADILALVEKITSKLQKYKSDSKAKDRQVKDLKDHIEQLVRANDSSCNQSDNNSVASVDVQYQQGGLFTGGNTQRGNERDPGSMFVGDTEGDGKMSYVKLEREYRLKCDELETVKLEFDQYRIDATQKRADLCENVAELKFNVRTLEQKLAMSRVQGKCVNEVSKKAKNEDDFNKKVRIILY